MLPCTKKLLSMGAARDALVVPPQAALRAYLRCDGPYLGTSTTVALRHGAPAAIATNGTLCRATGIRVTSRPPDWPELYVGARVWGKIVVEDARVYAECVCATTHVMSDGFEAVAARAGAVVPRPVLVADLDAGIPAWHRNLRTVSVVRAWYERVVRAMLGFSTPAAAAGARANQYTVAAQSPAHELDSIAAAAKRVPVVGTDVSSEPDGVTYVYVYPTAPWVLYTRAQSSDGLDYAPGCEYASASVPTRGRARDGFEGWLSAALVPPGVGAVCPMYVSGIVLVDGGHAVASRAIVRGPSAGTPRDAMSVHGFPGTQLCDYEQVAVPASVVARHDGAPPEYAMECGHMFARSEGAASRIRHALSAK